MGSNQDRARKIISDFVDSLNTLDCGDNSCYFAKDKTGMRTNGGCRCLPTRARLDVIRVWNEEMSRRKRKKEEEVGFYIQGPNKGKIDLIIKEGGKKLPFAPKNLPPKGEALVCVVDNGPFQAAAYCFDEGELRDFSDPDDTRPKTWMVMPEARAKELSSYPY